MATHTPTSTLREPTTPAPRSRRGALAFLAALIIFLAGCGARISTNIDVDQEGAGSRTMSFVAQRDADAENALNGGYEAVDTSLKSHLPEELEFSGLTITDEEITGSFTLAFSSLEDYEAKVGKLLETGGVDLEPEIKIVTSDDALKSGFGYEENFTSSELLAWAPQALVADGVLEEENASSVIDGEDKTTLTYNGETFEQPYGGRLNIDEVEDGGFDGVHVELTPLADGTYDVVVRFERNGSVSDEERALDDEFFASLDLKDTSLDTDVDPSASGYQRTLSFTAGDKEDLINKSEAIFGENTTVFEDVENTSDLGMGRMEREFSGGIESSRLCASYCNETFGVVTPQGYESEYYPEGEMRTSSLNSFNLVFDKSITFESLNVVLDIGMSRSWDLTLDVVVDTEEFEPFLDGIEESLTPTQDGATMSTSDADGMRTYTISFDSYEGVGGPASDYTGGLIGAEEIDGIEKEWIDSDYEVKLMVYPHEFLGTAEIKSITGTINLGTGNSFDDYSNSWDVDGSTATFQTTSGYFDSFYGYASGPTQSALIGWIIAGVVLLVVVVLVIVFRKKIAAAFSKAGQSAKVASASAAAGAAAAGAAAGYQGEGNAGAYGTASPDGAAGHGGAAGPGGAGSSGSGEFTEGDLR